MASPINPIFGAHQPGALNGPGGAQSGTVPSSTPSPTNTLNPLTPVANNPYAPPGSNPATVPGLSTTGGVTPGQGINWANQDYSVTGDFTQTYGQGTGSAITGVLQNLGTSNDAAIQATVNAADLSAQKGYANIQAQEAAAGITPGSSTAGLAAGDFYSTVQTNLNNTIAGMENQQEMTLLDTLITEGEQHGGDKSTWDSISSALGSFLPAIGSGAAGASAAISAANPSASTGVLDVLAGLLGG